MAVWPDAFPPCFAALAILYGEVAFPDRLIERKADQIRLLLINPETNVPVVRRVMKDLARGWQVTVDLVYTLLASVAVLVISVSRHDIAWGLGFFVLVFLFLTNVALLLRCAVVGPEETATIGLALPFRSLAVRQPLRYLLNLRPISGLFQWLGLSSAPTLRQISVVFVLLANALLVAMALFASEPATAAANNAVVPAARTPSTSTP